METSDLAGIALHDGLTDRHLAVAAEGYLGRCADADDGGPVKLFNHLRKSWVGIRKIVGAVVVLFNGPVVRQ